MNPELSSLTTELRNVTAETRQKFSGLTGEQLNWKPSAEKWSVGQCFDHLLVSNNEMLAQIEPLVEGKRAATFFERLPFLPKFFGGFLVRAVMPDNPKKMKNPGILDPAQSDVDPAVVEKFLETQKKAAAVMQASGHLDLEKTIMTSPVAGFITYSLLDGYRVIVYHGKRHLQQAERVTQAEGFPR